MANLSPGLNALASAINFSALFSVFPLELALTVPPWLFRAGVRLDNEVEGDEVAGLVATNVPAENGAAVAGGGGAFSLDDGSVDAATDAGAAYAAAAG